MTKKIKILIALGILATLAVGYGLYSLLLGGHISLVRVAVSYSIASPANTWFAATSTDNGNNTNWVFTAPPTATGNFFQLF